MNPMALPVSNQPIALIISTTGLKRLFMAYIPLLAGRHFHAAQMAQALMPQENICSCFGRYAYTFDQ
jgi:hypothetical protein